MVFFWKNDIDIITFYFFPNKQTGNAARNENKKLSVSKRKAKCANQSVFLADRTIVAPMAQCVVRLSVVCDVLYSGETAGPICMNFSGKVWSDHGTT